MKTPKLLVFDLDGTLVDSRTDLANAANAALKALGLPTLSKPTIVGYVGDGINTLLLRCLTDASRHLLQQAREYFDAYYRAHLLDHTTLLPGVYPVFESLHPKSHLTVLTNKSERYAKKILDGLGVARFFDLIVGERNGTPPKPDPDALRGIMAQLNGTPATTLMVGDGKNDILVAQKAGCQSCAVADTPEKRRQLEIFQPDFLITHMEELPRLFEDTP